jgi:hypothetical protein
MEESTAVEGKAAVLADSGKPGEAGKTLTEFVTKKCDEALAAASQILGEIKDLPRFTRPAGPSA